MIKRNILDCMQLVGATPAYYEGEKTYVSTGAVDCDHIDYEQTEFVTYDGRPSRANLSVSEGDILFAKMCGTKKTLRIDANMADHLYSTGFCAVHANESVMIADLLYHLLASEQFLTQKDQNSSGATQKAITNAGLKKITVPVPNLKEQRELATKLDCIERMMAKRREQIDYLDQLVKSRFIELFGDPKTNNKEWRMNTFADICTVRQGLQIPISKRLTQYEEGCYEYITVAYLHGSKEREYIKNPKSTVICTEEDVLMTRTGNTGMVITNVAGAFHNNFFLIDFDRTRYNKVFLVEYLNLDLIQAEIKRRAGTSTIPDLNHGEFYAISIYEPPVELQNAFAAFVEQTDKSKLAIQKSLDKLETLKKALMQKYFG